MTTKRAQFMTVGEEHRVLIEALRQSIQSGDTLAPHTQINLAVIDVMNLDAPGEDNRELIKTMTALHDKELSLPFIREMHLLLAARGHDITRHMLTEESLVSVKAIAANTNTRLKQEDDPLVGICKITGDMIACALASGDHDSVASIVVECRPETLTELQELHTRSLTLVPSLRDGII
jgi:hypothetical protein